MIYFATKARSVPPVRLADLRCSACGRRALRMTLFYRYVHLWFIPIIPIRRTAEVRCGACRRSWEEPAMDPRMAGSVEEMKGKTPTPKYFFAGLYLAGTLLLLAFHSQWREHRNTAQYITDPQRQDLYVMETAQDPEYPNIIMKVIDVNGDSVAMVAGRYVYSSAGDAARAVSRGMLDEPGYFVEGKINSRETLRRLYTLKKIVRIIREEN